MSVDAVLNSSKTYNDYAKKAIKHDVSSTVQQIRSLQFRLANYVFNDGRTIQLLLLHGTVPIYFRGNQYNIPVNIWMPDTYPNIPPICYVTPTPDMRIKERHKHVDVHGMVYLPYLHDWKPGTSTLYELVSYMSSVFSDDPPVYKYDPKAEVVHIPQPQPHHPLHAQPVARPVSPASHQAQLKDELVAKVTQKLKAALTQFNKETVKEMDTLFEQQAHLTANSEKIKTGVSGLRQERDQLVESIKALAHQKEVTEKWLQEHENKDQVNVDSEVSARDTWARQMIDAVANDFAIEDVMYQLDRALSETKIDLATYTKHIRKYARQQFFHRALASKIYQRQQYRLTNPQFT